MQRIFPTLATATAFTVALAATVLAADMAGAPRYAPPPRPLPVYNWTGFYLGANLGGSWGRESHELLNGTAGSSEGGFTHDPNGVIGGGQIGYNWQFAPWFGWGTGTVLGIEADLQGSGERSRIDGDFSDPIFGPVTFSGGIEDKLEWFGTVRGRAGIAFDRVLWYGTAGWAFGKATLDEGTLTSSNAAGVIASTAFNTSSNLGGWTAGGGIEWAFLGNWTAKFEYLHIDFGSRGNFAIPGGPFIIASGHFIDNVARAGINYKF
jgi:outer membrane immunogenic protein